MSPSTPRWSSDSAARPRPPARRRRRDDRECRGARLRYRAHRTSAITVSVSRGTRTPNVDVLPGADSTRTSSAGSRALRRPRRTRPRGPDAVQPLVEGATTVEMLTPAAAATSRSVTVAPVLPVPWRCSLQDCPSETLYFLLFRKRSLDNELNTSQDGNVPENVLTSSGTADHQGRKVDAMAIDCAG